jgi:hypothetical protein
LLLKKKIMQILKQVFMNQLYDEKTAEFRSARSLNDFQLSEALFLINIQCHFRILPQFFLLNQQHSLKTHQQFRQVGQFLEQGLVHCLQFQNKC